MIGTANGPLEFTIAKIGTNRDSDRSFNGLKKTVGMPLEVVGLY